MSNVVGAVKGHLASRASHRRTRSSIDHDSNPESLFLRGRASSLRQRALAEEEEDLVVSSPKDKNFHSLRWDDLRNLERPDFFSSTTTPVSTGSEMPTSAEYASEFTHFHNRHTFQEPRQAPAPSTGPSRGHRRTLSTPVVTSEPTTSAGRRPSLIMKRRPMPMSKSEPSPRTGAFPTINELHETSSPTTMERTPPPSPQPKSEPKADLPPAPQARVESLPAKHSYRSSKGVDVLPHHSPWKDPLSEDDRREPLSEKPKFIQLPQPNCLPPELHIYTPEYTNALKEWFPAFSQKDMSIHRDTRMRPASLLPGTLVSAIR